MYTNNEECLKTLLLLCVALCHKNITFLCIVYNSAFIHVYLLYVSDNSLYLSDFILCVETCYPSTTACWGEVTSKNVGRQKGWGLGEWVGGGGRGGEGRRGGGSGRRSDNVFFITFFYFTSLREQDEAYINSSRWSTLVGLELAYICMWVARSTTMLQTPTSDNVPSAMRIR